MTDEDATGDRTAAPDEADADPDPGDPEQAGSNADADVDAGPDGTATDGQSPDDEPAETTGDGSGADVDAGADGVDDERREADESDDDGTAETEIGGEGWTAVPDADDEARIEELESELSAREARIEELESELSAREERVDELEDRLRRTQADFQNYKKRAERKRERVRERATEDLVERLLDVRDNLRRALEEDDPEVESLIDGVEMTLREFDRVLEAEGVAEIAPAPGDDIDPTRHEVMMRTDSEQPADTVAEVYAPGYEMADEVIRPARVTVSTGPPEGDGEDAEEGTQRDAAATGGDE